MLEVGTKKMKYPWAKNNVQIDRLLAPIIWKPKSNQLKMSIKEKWIHKCFPSLRLHINLLSTTFSPTKSIRYEYQSIEQYNFFPKLSDSF